MRALGAAALLAVAATTAACGGTDEESYCDALAEEERTLADLAQRAAEQEGDVLTPTLASYERLREAAPEELADEWDTVVFAYRGLVETVSDLGVDPATYRPGKRPADSDGDLSRAEARRLQAVASKLASDPVRDALGGLEQHALDVCDVDFGA